MNIHSKNWFKFILGFVVCFLIRLIPFRPPNIEPILSTQMPFSKKYGAFAGFIFAFFSIVLFDVITEKIGVWTLLTAGAYGILGLSAAYYFKNKSMKRWDYVKFAIIGTIFFDAVTGLSLGPIFFQQPFMEALIGQIPFTLWHLLGNISFALVLSPAIYKFVIENKKQETQSLIKIFNPRQA